MPKSRGGPGPNGHEPAVEPAAAPAPAPAPPRERPLLRFVFQFVGLALVLFALYQLSEATQRFRYVNEWNAALSGIILNVTGVPTDRSGPQLTFASGTMEIISECSAIYVGILFAAAVAAFPTTRRARLLGLAFGLPVLFAINILRLVSLGAIMRFHPQLLPLVHEYLWQVFFVLVVAALYLLWIERMVPRAKPDR